MRHSLEFYEKYQLILNLIVATDRTEQQEGGAKLKQLEQHFATNHMN